MDRLTCGLIEVKLAGGDPAEMTFTGYGAIFGNVDSYGDVIAPGAFADTLAEARKTGLWPAMLSQHGGMGMTAEDMTPVGIWTDMAEDGIGLKLEGKFAPTARGQELHALMKMQPRPAINGLSIGYRAKEFSVRSKPEEPRRTLKKIDLFEVSPVTFPANGKARVTSVKGEDLTEREFERWLTQDAGFSRSEARTIINSGFKSLKAMRDAGDEGLDALAETIRRNTALIRA